MCDGSPYPHLLPCETTNAKKQEADGSMSSGHPVVESSEQVDGFSKFLRMSYYIRESCLKPTSLNGKDKNKNTSQLYLHSVPSGKHSARVFSSTLFIASSEKPYQSGR